MRQSTGMALVQMCEHNKCVAAHVLHVADDLGEVLFDFLELTVEDWITNRWRLEVTATEAVRTMAFCDLHSVIDESSAKPADNNKEGSNAVGEHHHDRRELHHA